MAKTTITFKSKVKSKNKKNVSFFSEDNNIDNLIGGKQPKILSYVGKEQTENVEGLKVNPVTANNAAIRLGMKVERESATITFTKRVTGKTIGRTTVFLGDNAPNSKPSNVFNAGVQGKDIKDYTVFFSSNLPRISINSDRNDFDNIFDPTVYGQGDFYKINDDKHEFIPFRDFGKIIPQDLIGKTHTSAYPFATDLKINFTQFVDPSISSFDGAIEVLSARQSLIDQDIKDFTLNSFKGELMGEGIDYSRKGSNLIENKREIKEGLKDYFLDSAETLFRDFTTPQVGVTGSSGKVFGIQGYSTGDFNILAPFFDKKPRDDSYTFLTNQQKELLLTGSDRSRSEIGYTHKSSNNGFFFGESNILGTDSIAFGGLKK